MPKTPLWKATLRSLLRRGDELADRLGERRAELLGPMSNCWSCGPIVSLAWPFCRTKSTGSTNSIPFLRPSASIRLACSMRSAE